MSDSTKSTRVDFQPSIDARHIDARHIDARHIDARHEQLVNQLGEDIGPSIESTDTEAGRAESPSDEELVQRVVDALKTIYDPEIPVNIYDLGLIYRVEVRQRFAEVDMTLTAPGCPVAQTFPGMVEGTVKLVPGIDDAVVTLVWDPPWRQELISEEARLELGLI